jgi:hypothetical protein
VRREVDALETTGLSDHVHRQAFFEGRIPRVAAAEHSFSGSGRRTGVEALSAAVFRGTEMRSAVTMVEAKQPSHSSKLSALCITSRSVILHPFGCGQFSGQGRSELASSHDD